MMEDIKSMKKTLEDLPKIEKFRKQKDVEYKRMKEIGSQQKVKYDELNAVFKDIKELLQQRD